jgi:undecaprenyl pyrophosphate synthase
MSNSAMPKTDGAAGPGAPRHVAIIMDGNGRWAAARGLPRKEGHRRGVEALRRAVRAAGDLGNVAPRGSTMQPLPNFVTFANATNTCQRRQHPEEEDHARTRPTRCQVPVLLAGVTQRRTSTATSGR